MIQKLLITILVSFILINGLTTVFYEHLFLENSRSNSNFKWMQTVMLKGTVSDKIAANTVTIQDNPICNLENIRNLVGMVKVGKKKECVVAIGEICLH